MRTLVFIGLSATTVGIAVALGVGGVGAAVLTAGTLLVGRALVVRRSRRDRPDSSRQSVDPYDAIERGWHQAPIDSAVIRFHDGRDFTAFERPSGEKRVQYRPVLQTAPPAWLADLSRPGVQRWWDGTAWTQHRRPERASFMQKPGAYERLRVVMAVVVVCAIVVAPFVGSTVAAQADVRADVVRVVDGDTVDVSVNGVTTRVRLLNIDTPETVDPARPVECLGPEATAFTKSLLKPGDGVTLKFDGAQRDPYGRTLASVETQAGVRVSEALAARGLGAPLDLGHGRFLAEVRGASEQAEATQQGLFDPNVDCTAPALVSELGQRSAAVVEQPDAATMTKLKASAAAATALVTLIGKQELQRLPIWRFYTKSQQRRMQTAVVALQDRAQAISDAPRLRLAEIKKQQQAQQRRVAARAKAARLAAQREAARALKAAKAREAARAFAEQESREEQSGGGDLSNYNGCRAYAPGGKTWKPIPCPR